jgi:hypothetical protein
MYGIYANTGAILMVNVTIYGIHGMDIDGIHVPIYGSTMDPSWVLIPRFRMNSVGNHSPHGLLRTYLGVESEAPDLKSLMLQDRLSEQAP